MDKEAKKVDDDLTKKIKSFELELDEAMKKHGSHNPDKVKRSTTGNTAARKGLNEVEDKVPKQEKPRIMKSDNKNDKEA